MVKGGRYGMSGVDIINVITQLINNFDVEKIHIEYWQHPKEEEKGEVDSCLVKVNIEKEWV